MTTHTRTDERTTTTVWHRTHDRRGDRDRGTVPLLPPRRHHCEAVDRLLAGDLAICDPVAMEVLAGARDEHHLAQLRGLLGRASILTPPPADYDAAASLYRACRVRRETVRKRIDCLIAAIAIRAGAELLHADADFAAIARHTDLQLHPSSTQ